MLQRPKRKIHWATIENLQALAELKRRCYLWTWTFKEGIHDKKRAAAEWDKYVKRMRKQGIEPAIYRFIELHPGGHGIHFHGITFSRGEVVLLRDYWQRGIDGGRVHVKRIPWAKAKYVAKYLSKDRPTELKHAKLVHRVNAKNFPPMHYFRAADVYSDTSFSRFVRMMTRLHWELLSSYTWTQRCQWIHEKWLDMEMRMELPPWDFFSSWRPNGLCIQREQAHAVFTEDWEVYDREWMWSL